MHNRIYAFNILSHAYKSLFLKLSCLLLALLFTKLRHFSLLTNVV